MVKGSGLTYFVNRGWVFERMDVFECRWVVERGWAIVGDVVRGGVASSLVTWYTEGGVVVGDVARERVAVVASPSLSLVTWYAGGWRHRW